MNAVSDDSAVPAVAFSDFELSPQVLQALQAVGYEAPSPIQAATIPHLLAGTDILGQAQTGTGKTAAFALPILTKIDLERREPQALVLVPTRELAIQVAEAFQRYAAHLAGFHVLPIYGGQSYTPQLQSLRRGVHVIVATPGRVMDHLKRGTLRLDTLRYIVLDEADEMLQMGFLEDVEWVLRQAPAERIIALFSATLPAAVRRIAQTHLRSPAEVIIRGKTATAGNIRQRYWLVSGMHKLDALTRILEAEPFEAMLVFARTKQSTVELAERLEARGFAVEALNGDIQQSQRERTIQRLKAGQIDIVVATDVAARGLDVERVSHVVNFDVPYDSESYIHRIGRTGRAGRSGEAILFIAPRERNMLRTIERATRQNIAPMELPTIADVNEQRVARFKLRITDALATDAPNELRPILEQYEREHNVPAIEIAAALASIVQGKTPLRLAERKAPATVQPAIAPPPGPVEPEQAIREERAPRAWDEERGPARPRPEREAGRRPRGERDDSDKETYRIEVGHLHGVQPGNIVGAIANETGIEGRRIGRVDIRDDHSFVDLPAGMPKEVFLKLQKVRVAGQQLQIGRARKPPAREPHERLSFERTADAPVRSGERPERRPGKKRAFEPERGKRRFESEPRAPGGSRPEGGSRSAGRPAKKGGPKRSFAGARVRTPRPPDTRSAPNPAGNRAARRAALQRKT